MTEEKKPVKVEVEWAVLERIAQYYQFPTAVFLFKDTKGVFIEPTRDEAVLKQMKELRAKLNDLFEQYLGD